MVSFSGVTRRISNECFWRRKSQTDSCKPHFINLKILTLPSLYIYEVINYIRTNLNKYKNYKSKRQFNKINCPAHSTMMFNKSIFCMGPRFYNHLPKNILEIKNNDLFKRKIKDIMLNKAYYSVDEYLHDKSI